MFHRECFSNPASDKTCNICGDIIPEQDDMVNDFLAQEYPGQTICRSCDFKITAKKYVAVDNMLGKNATEAWHR